MSGQLTLRYEAVSARDLNRAKDSTFAGTCGLSYSSPQVDNAKPQGADSSEGHPPTSGSAEAVAGTDIYGNWLGRFAAVSGFIAQCRQPTLSASVLKRSGSRGAAPSSGKSQDGQGHCGTPAIAGALAFPGATSEEQDSRRHRSEGDAPVWLFPYAVARQGIVRAALFARQEQESITS
jgi:hypothetical protein